MSEGTGQMLLILVGVIVGVILISVMAMSRQPAGDISQSATAHMCVNMPGLTAAECGEIANDPEGPGAN